MKEIKLEEIKDVIGEFERFYLIETLKYRRQKDEITTVNFRDFVSQPQYKTLKERLELTVKSNGSYDNLEQLIFDNLSKEQKTRIGGLFHVDTREFIDRGEITKKANLLEKYIQKSEEVKGYVEVKDYLNDEQKERLASKLSTMLYNQLDDDEKKLVDEKTIKRYLLNIGFIRMHRPTHRKAIDFIKQYPSLFENEDDVVFHILERYVDEELTNTPITQTQQRINELKHEVRELYRSIKHES